MKLLDFRAWLGRRQHNTRRPSFFRPALESLEGRIQPAAFTNGSFTQGTNNLGGWTVSDAQLVSVNAAHQAVITESAGASEVDLYQDFVIPQGASRISYTFQIMSTDASVPAGDFPDAFGSSLLNPQTLAALVPTVDNLTDSYFVEDVVPNATQGQAASGATVVSGSSPGSLQITVDVSALSNQNVRLLFRFIGGSDGSQVNGSVAVSDVEVAGAAPSATFTNNGPISEGGSATFSFANPVASTSNGIPSFTYSYDFNNDGNFTDPGEFSDVTNASASAAFTEEGTYTIVGEITDQTGAHTDYTSILIVNDLPVTATATPVTTFVKGVAFSGEVATFTDANTQAPLNDFLPANTTILWGDGSTTNADTISEDVNGVFHVFGSHTYAAAGQTANPLQVTVKDVGGAHSNTTSYTPTVADAAVIAAATPVTTAVEGISFSGEVATFTDANPADTVSNYPLANITIAWGDGSTTNATSVTRGAGQVFHVFGSHTYADEGSTAQPLQVTIKNSAGIVSNPTSYTPVVGDAPLTATATPVTTAMNGVPFSGEVATFTDADPQATLSDFPLAKTTIQWGDGNSSNATSITQDNSKVFHVFGSHTYAQAGLLANPIDVDITDVGGATNGAQAAVTVAPNPHGIGLTVTPATLRTGEGMPVQYTVRVKNTGLTDDSFALSVANLPASVSAVFAQTPVSVPAGANSFVDVILTLTPGPGTTAQRYVFQVNASSTTNSSLPAMAQASLTVVPHGGQVAISPASGPPGTVFKMTVTNTGISKDTFTLSLGGTAAKFSHLALSNVTLAAGTSTTVSITTKVKNSTLPGTLTLTGTAKSKADPTLTASASTSLVVPVTLKVSAQLSPVKKTIPKPGPANYVLFFANAGNVQDSYSITIAAVSGPIMANLLGPGRLPTQSISGLQLSVAATDKIVLQTKGNQFGMGTVTIKIRSLTDANISTTVVATLNIQRPGRRSGPG